MALYEAIFFDVDNTDHTDLLHSSVRENDELENVVDKVEYEILDYYKQRPSVPLRLQTGRENLYTTNEINVRLIDYDNDDPENSEDDLKDAIIRTVAEVASWVLRNYNQPQGGVSSISQGNRSIDFVGSAPSWNKWPDGWNHWLRNFDDREALYSV